MEADDFMASVERVCAAATELSPLQAAVLVALDVGAAADTRTFAKLFGIAHALVLRAVANLDGGYLRVVGRDARTQRTRLELTSTGHALTVGAPERIAA